MSLKISWFVVLALGVVAWAKAIPVRTVDIQTGNITILDKASGQKVSMTKNKLSYAKDNKQWSVVTNNKYDFIDVTITDYGVVVISDDNKIEASLYNFGGKLIWKIKLQAERYHFGLGKSNNQRFINYSYLSGEPFMQLGGLIDVKNGKEILGMGNVLEVWQQKNLALIQGEFDELPGPVEDMMLNRAQDDLETTRLRVDNLDDSAKGHGYFLTPFRKGCIGYEPTADKFVPSYYATDKEIEDLNKKTSGYIENIVRGEYIYAHRADHCGKFTYRFHWTDLKHPGPVILQGWQ